MKCGLHTITVMLPSVITLTIQLILSLQIYLQDRYEEAA
jgi:hypothetical protein